MDWRGLERTGDFTSITITGIWNPHLPRRPGDQQRAKAWAERRREWQQMRDEGVYPTTAALARGTGVSRAMIRAGREGSPKPILENRDINDLAK